MTTGAASPTLAHCVCTAALSTLQQGALVAPERLEHDAQFLVAGDGPRSGGLRARKADDPVVERP
jgi:hypothetical protein